MFQMSYNEGEKTLKKALLCRKTFQQQKIGGKKEESEEKRVIPKMNGAVW